VNIPDPINYDVDTRLIFCPESSEFTQNWT